MLDEVTLKEYANNSNGMFAIMVQNEEGEYEEYTDSTSWPTGMVFNASMSGCIDNNGNTLDNVLSFDASSNTASVSTSETSYCYLYFSLKCGIGTDLSNCLISTSADSGGTDTTLILHEEGCDNYCAEDGHYRYSGADEDVNNYICFGASDLDTCLSDTDTYLFRIIEINPDDGAVKIIKATALAGDDSYSSYSGSDDLYYWNSTDGTSDTALLNGSAYNYWAVDDTLYATLAYDLNTTYLSTFGSVWQSIILTYSWNISGDSYRCPGYPINGWTSSCYAIGGYNYESKTTGTFKIGLMNIYDYGFAASTDFWDVNIYYYYTDTYTYSAETIYNVYDENGAAIDSDWLYSGISEWSITRYISQTEPVFTLTSTGVIYLNASYSSFAIRPAFYIDGYNLLYSSGTGTETSPYVVSIN